MNTVEARRLVQTTFKQPYNEGRMRVLIRNLFPGLKEHNDRWVEESVPDAFSNAVQQYQRLGEYEDLEGLSVDVLAVKLKAGTQLERARSAQRNFVARYLNNGRDAALVAFYSDDEEDWRFSLVRMDYTFSEGKVAKELTPARRFSFLVGPNEGTHTAERQLSTVLADDDALSLTMLEAAFNIESVTEEFFDAYKGLFVGLKEELDALAQTDLHIRAEFAAKGIDTATFAKRLLGQIVFLYFLQKKGWLGVCRKDDGSLGSWGTGPKDFLRRLFEGQVVPYNNFFDDLLEPLFYEALARERDESAFYSRFNCRIPFLNGGLFEPVGDYNWAETRINLKNETLGRIFSTFDLYNFTVREDEPLDKEVAVDPEMLGKVFENLLGVRDRKSKGAFYTPREIVHYMCQESLINYLDTAVNTVTRPLQKPAPEQAELFGRPRTRQAPLTEEVYEERVPRTDLAEFIRLSDAVQEYNAATASRPQETDVYRFQVPWSVREQAAALDGALADIKICDPAVGSGAFPVGMMNEIVRARRALNPHLGTKGRAVYDFKRHAIQESIYGVDIEESAVDIAKLRLWLSLIVDEDDYGTIKPLPNLEYKIVIGNSLLGVKETLFNNELFERLENLRQVYTNETRASQKNKLRSQIESLLKELTDGSERFDFKIHFSEVFRKKNGFDVFIGNPPYVSSWNMGKEHKRYFVDNFVTATGHYDLYVLFYEKSIAALRNKGFLSFITSNKWMSQKYGLGLRKLLLQNRISKIIDFSKLQVFDSATVDTQITLVNKEEVRKPYRFNAYSHIDGNLPQFNNIKFTHIDTSIFSITEELNFKVELTQSKIELIEKMQAASTRLDDICYISKGAEIHKADGTSKDAFLHKEFHEHLEPYAEGKNISRWYVEPGTYLQYSPLEHKAPVFREFFDANKIVNKRTPGRNRLAFTVDRTGYFTNETVNNAILYKDLAFIDRRQVKTWLTHQRVETSKLYTLEFLVGLLNSRLLYWFYDELLANGLHFYPSYMRQLPIRTINSSDPADRAMHDEMVALVERMLQLHEEKGKAGAQPAGELEAEIERTDTEIDALVYKLYGLNDEEIKIVEAQ